MKEFYLIPKTVYNRMEKQGNFDNPLSNLDFKENLQNTNFLTSIPPISQNVKTLKKNKVNKPVKLNTLNTQKRQVENNPDLSSLIRINFGENLREHALAFYDILKKDENIKWNENGDMLYPLNKYNLIDVIRDLMRHTKLDEQEITDYNYILSVTNIPHEYIRNRYISKYNKGNIKKKKGGTRVKSSWIPY